MMWKRKSIAVAFIAFALVSCVLADQIILEGKYTGFLASVLYNYQSLAAGLIALGAAYIAAAPVWRQLERMSVQTNAMFRDYLADRVRDLSRRRKWLDEQLDPFELEVGRRVYEMRELEAHLDIQWVFQQSLITSQLIAELEKHEPERRDPAAIAVATDELMSSLDGLKKTLDAIHRPASSGQSGEDWSYTDEEWSVIKKAAESADAELDGSVSRFSRDVKRLDEAIGLQLKMLRDRIKRTDDALLRVPS
jgi:hypothetical protein